MNMELAKKLLISTMNWDETRTADELSALLTLASYKYDGYRNFEPGMRFFESLVRWLAQFQSCEERETALDFVKERLVFISEAEIAHLISLVYPDHIFPILCEQAAKSASLPAYKTAAIKASQPFQLARRRSLFLGLSDGARIDTFRRLNPFLSNEQVYVSYEISADKLQDMCNELRKEMEQKKWDSEPTFQNLFLLDDFSGSGTSLLRDVQSQAGYAGKLAKIVKRLVSEHKDCFDQERLQIYILLYLSSYQSEQYLENKLPAFKASLGVERSPYIAQKIIYRLPESIQMSPETDPAFHALLEAYYDKNLEDRHTQKGGTNLLYGYAGCGLPLVLDHNTPNNSVYLLWAETERSRALFRRITRHKEERSTHE